MRFPRLRLRLPRPSFEWLGGAINRTTVLYGLFTLVLFLVFLVVNFPHDVLVRRVVSRLNLSPLALDFNSAGFAWHKGYELRGLRLSAAAAPEAAPLLECTTLDVRPLLAGLLRGQLSGLTWQGELYGGSAGGQWTITSNGGAGQVDFAQLDLGRYRPLTAYLEEGQLGGQVAGSFSVQLGGGEQRSAQVAGELTVNRPGLIGARIAGIKLPDLQFAQAKGQLNLKGERLELQEVRLSGDQLSVSLSGQMTFREPLGSSALNLRITFEQSAATPTEIKALLALIPRPANARPDAPITLAGTLAAPQVR
ncbi:MAG: type II secretion system protein GspN [Deltaproteobacteria bacterium]|nr:type II secretion system protein GspN [Deltaproteobacteria bacterium]